MDTNGNPLNYYVCYKCKFGYSGRLKKLDKRYYQSNCNTILNCSIATYYSGFGLLPNQLNSNGTFPSIPLDTFLTCHNCITSTKIPFFAITDRDVTLVYDPALNQQQTYKVYNLMSYDLKLNPPNQKAVKQQQSQELVFCYDYKDIEALDPDNNFPLYCGAGMIIINLSKQNYKDSNTSILCMACKPGYRPLMYSFVNYAVETCEKIQNCLNSTRFNACSQCEKGYSLKYDTTSSVYIND